MQSLSNTGQVNQQRKQCTKCKVDKTLDLFANRIGGILGKRSSCKECDNKYASARNYAVSVSEQKCKECGALKTFSDFHRNKNYRSGIAPWCKACEKLYRDQSCHTVTATHKICTVCDILKNANSFHIHKNNSDGLSGQCKDCYNAKIREWLQTNAGKLKQRRSRESVAAKYIALKSSARKRGVEFLLSKQEYFNIVSLNTCEYCKLSTPETGYGLDRKDSKLGYTNTNVVPCCKYCNTAKLNYWTNEDMKSIVGPAIRIVRMKNGLL